MNRAKASSRQRRESQTQRTLRRRRTLLPNCDLSRIMHASTNWQMQPQANANLRDDTSIHDQPTEQPHDHTPRDTDERVEQCDTPIAIQVNRDREWNAPIFYGPAEEQEYDYSHGQYGIPGPVHDLPETNSADGDDDDPEEDDDDLEETGIPEAPNGEEQVGNQHEGHGQDEEEEAVHKVLKNSKFLLSWTNMYALLSVCGSVRVTVDQHSVFRFTLNWSRSELRLPSYRTVKRAQFPFLLHHCFLGNRLFTFDVGDAPVRRDDELDDENGDSAKNPQQETTNIGTKGPHQVADVRIVFPTEWAKFDVITSAISTSLIRQQNTDRRGYSQRGWSLCHSAIVRKKSSVLDPTFGIFLRNDGRLTIARRGDDIFLNLLQFPSGLPRDRTELGFQFDNISRGVYRLHGRIAHTWCVTHAGHNGSTAGNIPEDITEVHRIFLQGMAELGPQAETPTATLINDIDLIPGDVRTLIEGANKGHSSWVCVLVNRFCTTRDGQPSRQLLWFRSDDTITPRSWQVHKQLVRGVDIDTTNDMGAHDDSADDEAEVETKDMGVLESGERYVVYRILLYTDDFRTASDKLPMGSAGGCYILPVNLPSCDRRTRSAVRLISLTPPGVSTNRVLHAIAPDLVKGTIEGVEGFLPTGEKVRIFLDVLGYVGDYPASCHVIDSMTHTANAPCTLCNFRKFSGGWERASRYGYTADVHARNSATFRNGDRHQALRTAGVEDETCRRLGMTISSEVTDMSCPLIALQRELNRHRGKEMRNMEGRRVVNALFDAYRSSIVAPDHLLTGLGKNILSLLLALTPTPKQRSLMDIRVCDELRRNGLLQQKTILKADGKGLAAMSLSGLFCVLCVAGLVFATMFQIYGIVSNVHECAVDILNKLRKLAALTYWNPQRHIDGENAVASIDEDEGEAFFEKLRGMAERYVKAVNELCTMSAIAAKHLDKPNLHRLLELYNHTVPAYGHANHFMELVFECAHQPLKRCMQRGNHKKGHIMAVEHCIGNDWQARLMLLREEAQGPDQAKARQARFGLRRLMLGRSILEIYSSNPDRDELFETMDQAISEVFVPPVEYLLNVQCMPFILRSRESSAWVGYGKSRRSEGKVPGVHMDEQNGKEILRAVWDMYALINPYGPQNFYQLRLFPKMRRVRKGTCGEARSTGNKVDVVSAGDVVQVMVGMRSSGGT